MDSAYKSEVLHKVVFSVGFFVCLNITHEPLSRFASHFDCGICPLLHRLVLSVELGTVHNGNGKVDPALKFKGSTAARVLAWFNKLKF